MKEYKVGDTVFVKGKITDVDHNETMLPYCVVSSPNYHFWASQESVIDELPTSEPVKPVLPKAVADELESAKENCNNFYGFLRDCNSETHPEANQFVFYSCGSSDSRIKILSDAWYNGYTIEQVPRYMVYVPGTNKRYLYVKRGSWAKASNKKTTPITPQFINNYLATSSNHRDLYWFTDEEITKFDLQNCEKELVADD